MTTSVLAIPYVDLKAQHLKIKEEILEAVSEVIDGGQFVLGPQVAEFEQKMAQICGTKEAIAMNSGSDALILSLKALGVGPGHEVITVPNSFVVSTSCIELVGAKAVFVDVGADYNLDPRGLAAALTPRSRAILPVHLTGRPADMGPILAFAKKHNLFVIEDCAQAIQAEYHGQPVGSFGDAGCFSLHPLKTLNALGDGGVVTTNNVELAQKLRLYRNLGLKTREDCVLWSSNSRLDTMQAAILLVKLKYLNEWTEARIRNAALYRSLLQGIKGVQCPLDHPYEKSVYHTFIILAEQRDALKAFLAEEGIGTAIHYPMPIHKQTVAKEYAHLSFPVAESQAAKILSLPIHQDLSVAQIEHIAQTIKRFYQG
jgi:dTDP-4-amino-4,6-dideoxygalactose transaminase